MIHKILLIKGFSAYSAVRVFVEELGKGLESLDVRCKIFDANDYDKGDGFFTKELYPALLEALEWQPDAILSASGLLLNSLKRCMRKVKMVIPVIAYFVDHPFWEHERLTFSLDQYYTVFVDENFTRYASTYYSASKAVATVRQAGIQSAGHVHGFKDRKKGIVFFGSYGNSERIYKEIVSEESSATVYIKRMLEYGIEHPEKTVESIVLNVFGEFGICLPPGRIPVILSSMTMVESYLRSYFRERCIKAFIEHGIEIDIYGDGWEKLSVSNEKLLHTHAAVDYREMADIMTKYQYSLNVLPWAKAGFHDRIATSMLNGCVCISDTSTYIESEKLSESKMIVYHLGDETELVSRMKRYMSSEDIAEEMAMEGKKYALEKHTWKNRAEIFLEVMEHSVFG